VGLAKAGDPIKVEIRREGQTREIIVRSGIRPSEETIASNGRTPPKPGAGDADEGPALAALGLRVAPDPKGQGVRIAGINQSSDAAQKGLRTGDIVLRVGDHATNSAADLKSAVAEAKKAGKKSVLLFVARGDHHTFIPVEIGEG
jgi:serine protease Do